MFLIHLFFQCKKKKKNYLSIIVYMLFSKLSTTITIKITIKKIVIIFNFNHHKFLTKRSKALYEKKSGRLCQTKEKRKAIGTKNFCG